MKLNIYKKKCMEHTIMPHDEVFDFIFEKANPFSCLDYANSLREHKFDKLTRDEHAYFCALKTLDYFRENGKDIRVIDGKNPVVYNGQYWKPVERWRTRYALSKFIRKAKDIDQIGGYNVYTEDALPKWALRECGEAQKPKDTDTARVNFNDGTLYINNKGVAKFKKHSPSDYLQYALDYDYTPSATCPNFDAFLNKVLPNESQQKLLFDYLGSCFFRKLKLEKVLVMLGDDFVNGKGKLIDIIEEVFGKDNIGYLHSSQLLKKYPNSYLPLVEGNLLNKTYGIGRGIDGERLKDYASGEPIKYKRRKGGYDTIDDYPRMMVSIDVLPKNKKPRKSFFDLTTTIPLSSKRPTLHESLEFLDFNKELPRDEQVHYLNDENIKNEKIGILNRILEGAKNIAKTKKLPTCKISQRKVDQYANG